MIFGGYTLDEKQNDTMYVLDGRKQKWTSHGDQMPERYGNLLVHRVMVCTLGESLVVMITHSDKVPSSHIWMYEAVISRWHDITFNKKFRAHATLTALFDSFTTLRNRIDQLEARPTQPNQSTSEAKWIAPIA